MDVHRRAVNDAAANLACGRSPSRTAPRRAVGAPNDCRDAAWFSSDTTDMCGASTTETATASGAPARGSKLGLGPNVSASISVSPIHIPCALPRPAD